jgi:hypothetical protein
MGSELIYLENEFDNIALINPNKIVNDEGFPEDRNIKQEDLVMYANLECNLQPRSRLLAGNDVQTLQTVAIASVNFLKPNGQDNLTTRWTEIQNQNQDPNVINSELLGITNITYRVGPAQAATVDMQLEDVRGRALFESNENSIYSVFFNLPYPTFYLTLKGYMGKAVQYQLMLVKFQASMDPGTGNFLINLNFQSYKFNVLTDIQWGYVQAVPNMYSLTSNQNIQTTSSDATNASVSQINSNNSPINSVETSIGYKKIIQVYDEYKRKKLIPQNFPYLTIQQLIVRLENFEKNILQNIQKVSVEELTDSEVFQRLLEEFLILVETGNGTTSWKGEFLDFSKFYILKNNGDTNGKFYKVYPYKENITNYESAESKLNEIINQNNKKLSEVNTFGKLSDGPNVIESTITLNSLTGPFYEPIPGVIDINQTAIERSGSQNPQVIAQFEDQIIAELRLLDNKKMNEEDRRSQKGIVDARTPFLFRFDGKGFFNNLINEMKQLLESKTKKIEEDLTNAINLALKSEQGIGFEPTLRNVLAVIMASSDAFLRMLCDVHDTAFKNGDNNRKKNSVREDVKNDPKSIVYPWPQYSKEINVDGVVKFDLQYPGDPKYIEDSGAYDYQAWPEVQFVEEFVKGYTKRQQVPLSPTSQSNEVTTIKRLCVSGFDIPSNVVFSNYQEINFLFEMVERVEAIIRYQGYLQSPPKITNIFNVLMSFEASNILISLGKDNQNINKILKEGQFNNYTEFLNFIKNASSGGIGNLWLKYISLAPTPEYLKNELKNPSRILKDPSPNISESIVTETNANEEENKLVDYLNSASVNNGTYSSFTIPFTQTYPFISENWHKLYLQEGNSNFSINKVLDTSKTVFYNSKVKKIVNYTGDYSNENQGDSQKIKPFNFFVKISEPIDFTQVSSNLDSFYFLRQSDPKKSFYTEGSLFNSTNDVKSTISTSSMLNMPFFIKSIQNGVTSLKGGSEYPFLQSSYFFLNSLPLTNLKGRYIDDDGQVRNYVGPSFKKFGAVHRIPKLLACKIGSIWFRYKNWIESGTDFLTNAMGPLNQNSSYDPVNSDPNFEYEFNSNGTLQYVKLNSIDTSSNGEIIESMNVGFYPSILNDFYFFLNGENLYNDITSIQPDIQTKIDESDIKLISNSQSQINKPSGYNPNEPTKGLGYKTTSVLFKVKSQPLTENTTYYFSAPSFGSRYTQVTSECFTGPTPIRNVFNNQYVYNGSVRFFWGGTHFGYAPTINQLCLPTEYPSYTQNNLWPWFVTVNSSGNNTTLDYIDDLFSVFTKDELDIFETEFKNFSRATNQCEDDFNIQSLLRKAMQVQESDFNINDTNTNILLEKFQTSQLKNFNGVIDEYINRNLLYQKGNPSSYNSVNFFFLSDKNYYTNKPVPEYKSITENALPTSGFTKSWTDSQTQYPEAWKALKTYVGFCEDSDFSYGGPYSFITDFFPDLNIAFTVDNVIRFAQDIKIYASRKFVNKGQSSFNFRAEMTQYLELVAQTINTVFSGVLTKVRKGLPSLAVENNVDKNSATEGTLSKLQYYNNFKAINDKWVAGNNYNSQTLFEDILLLDRAGRDIGDKIYIDVLSIKEALKGADVASNIYSQVGGIIETNHFKIFSMPAYINFYGVQDVGDTTTRREKFSHPFATDLFGTFTEVDYQDSKSKLVCVYTELPSEQTENPAITNGFLDDAFNLGNSTKNPNVEGNDVKDAKDDYAISNKCVGFAVDFGLQNQGVFTQINVSQDIGKATAESLYQTYELANLYNGTKSSTQSVSLYNIYTTRSYQAQITAMGNAMIQPTMYFVLRNVPLFAGPYYIDNVQHSITNGSFKTTFTGTRQKLYTPPLENALLESIKTTFLSQLVNNLVTKRQTEKKVEQNTIQTKNAISNQINSTFEPSNTPICQPQPSYDNFSAAKPSAYTESVESMWKKVRDRVNGSPGFVGTGMDYIVFTLFYVNSFDGSKFKYYNNNVSQVPIGTGVPKWGGDVAEYFNKEYICMNGSDNLSQAYVTFPSVDNCINFNLLRYEKTFQTVLPNISDENLFVSGFTKTWIEYVPYSKVEGTNNLYENFVQTNKTEFDKLTEKVRKSYKLVRSYTTQ